MLGQEYPIVVQPTTVMNTNGGFEYCPCEALQIIHTGAHHWILLSSLKREVKIYDSLNTTPTEATLNAIRQLYSPDESMPPFVQHKCHKQVGGTDCGVFAVAYAVDLLLGNDPSTIKYDQSKMRDHLMSCLENGKF